jgi:hypothetical protein
MKGVGQRKGRGVEGWKYKRNDDSAWDKTSTVLESQGQMIRYPKILDKCITARSHWSLYLKLSVYRLIVTLTNEDTVH